MPQQSEGCQAALVIPKSNEPNIFTPEQEVELGDVLTDFAGRWLNPFEDDGLAAHLRAIGDRLVAQLPATGLRFRFYLADWAGANANSWVGGRVYVSRKLISFAKTEDEIAGVLAHELGHIVTHQTAIDITRAFQQLGITEVGDKRDIFDKWNRFLESGNKSKGLKQRVDDEQLGADRVGIEIATRAGYDPQALPAFLDRLTENKGKTGSWWSDIFQGTPPNAKRYRELLKTVKSLPANCGTARAAGDGSDFTAWRAAVLRTNSVIRRENLQNVLWRKSLDPPLVEDFHTLRFSPDGKYIMAQDSSSVYILTRQPFEFVFRIDAPSARPSQFTPDSTGVVFYDRELRVERWDLVTRQRVEADEVVIQKACMQTRLAPDGRTLACINREYDLLLVDVATGDHILEREHFSKPKVDVERGIYSIKVTVQVNYLNMEFSPDGRYFVAAAKNGNSLAFELSTRQEVPLRSAVKEAISTSFTFIASDRIAGSVGQRGEKSVVTQFPSGELIQRVDFGSAHVGAVTRGNYVLLRPIRDYAVGVLDLEHNEIIRASKDPALDVFDRNCVSQLKSGELGLFEGTATPVATVTVPRGPLGRLHATAVSDDFSWLAVSFTRRGAVWNLQNGQMAFNLRGFSGAWFGDDGGLYAEFPKDEKSGHTVAHVNLSSHAFMDAQKLDQDTMRQRSRYLVNLHPPGKPKTTEADNKPETIDTPTEGVDFRFEDILRDPPHNEVLDVSDARSGSLIWSIPFPKEVPRIFWNTLNDRVSFAWQATGAGLKAERQRAPESIRAPVSAKEQNYIIEVVQLSTGKVQGSIEIDTHEHAFWIWDVWSAGDYILISDSLGRQTVYSMSTGQMVGRVIGKALAFAAAPQPVVLIEPGRGRLQFFDPTRISPREELAFSRGLSLVRLTTDGKKLFVVKSDQVAYLIDVSQITAPHGPEGKATSPAGNLP
jgi:WD40 repeat protein